MHNARYVIVSYLLAAALIAFIGVAPIDHSDEHDVHLVDPSVRAWPVELHEATIADERTGPFDETVGSIDPVGDRDNLLFGAGARARSERIALTLLARGAVCAPSSIHVN